MTLVPLRGGPPPNFDDPVAVLRAHHRETRRWLDRLTTLSATLDDRESWPHWEPFWAFFLDDDIVHGRDESLSVLPRLLGKPSLLPAIDRMTEEHGLLEALLLSLRVCVQAIHREAGDANALVPEARNHARAFADVLLGHMEHEEREILPALGQISPAILRGLGLEMQTRRGRL